MPRSASSSSSSSLAPPPPPISILVAHANAPFHRCHPNSSKQGWGEAEDANGPRSPAGRRRARASNRCGVLTKRMRKLAIGFAGARTSARGCRRCRRGGRRRRPGAPRRRPRCRWRRSFRWCGTSRPPPVTSATYEPRVCVCDRAVRSPGTVTGFVHAGARAGARTSSSPLDSTAVVLSRATERLNGATLQA